MLPIRSRILRFLTVRSDAMLAAALLLALPGSLLRAQAKVLQVAPPQTGADIQSVHGPHIAVYNPQAPSNHRLFVFFVGTGGTASRSLPMLSAFAGWGYHAIALDYEDNVIAASCVHSQDEACFDRYRDTIVTGAPGSEKIKVDKPNSILNRLQKLLVYLQQHDPGGGWSEFMAGDQPMWSRMVVAGHSQGSGHAAYIGKLYRVAGVLMFSGPQDYLAGFHEPAPWQARPGATPASRFYAFLSENDPWDVHRQIANCGALMEEKNPQTEIVQPGQPITGSPRILINTETKGAHGSTVRPEFENVWKYLATTGEADTEN